MDQFLSLNIGQIGQVIAVLIGMGIMFQGVKGDVKAQGDDIRDIKEELSELRKVVISNARLEEQVNAMDQRLLLHGRRVDRVADMLFRHGAEPKEYD